MRPDLFLAIIALNVPFRPRGFGASGLATTLVPPNENAVFYQFLL
jgi:hypothetical protein